MPSQNETDNYVIWDRNKCASSGHVESYFLKCNDPQQNMALWLKFTIYSPKGAPEKTVGEVWGIFFDAKNPKNNVGIKETYPIETCVLGKNEVHVEMGKSFLKNGETKGEITGKDGAVIRWSIKFTTDKPPLHHFPIAKMYTAKIPKSKAKSPHPDSRFSGGFNVSGQSYIFKNIPGMQGHNWGSEHANTYAWAHCNAFENEDGAYFEGFSSKVKIGPIMTPFISSAFLFYKDELIKFNDFKSLFSKRISVEYNAWTFSIENAKFRITGNISAPKELFCGLHYYDPTGALSFCLNSKVSNAEIKLYEKSSAALLREFISKNTTALEVLTKDTAHGVRMVA